MQTLQGVNLYMSSKLYLNMLSQQMQTLQGVNLYMSSKLCLNMLNQQDDSF